MTPLRPSRSSEDDRHLYAVDIDETGTRLIVADTAAQAALAAARACSVGQMRKGARARVWQVGLPDGEFLLRYERPNAEAPAGVDERLGGDYGRVVCLSHEEEST